MVLTELGSKLRTTLSKLHSTTVVTDDLLKSTLSEICRALIESDVNIKLVSQIKKNIKLKISMEGEEGGGGIKRKLIQKAVTEELVNLLEVSYCL